MVPAQRHPGAVLMATARVVAACLKKDFRILRRHPLNTVNLVLLPLYQFLIPSLLLGSAFLVNGRAIGLDRSAGTSDVAGFLFLGAAVSSLTFGTFWGVTWATNREMDAGTLEHSWLTPVPREVLMLGTACTSLLVSCLAGSVLFVLGAVAFGAHYRPAVLQAIPALAIVLLSLVGIAFLVASVNLVAKRANFMVDSISYLLVVTSGVLFPLSVMPVVFRAIGLLLPVTYSLDLLRAGALGSRPFLPVAQEYLVLSGLGLALLVAGRWVFLKTERRLRTEGSLGFH